MERSWSDPQPETWPTHGDLARRIERAQREIFVALLMESRNIPDETIYWNQHAPPFKSSFKESILSPPK